MQGHLEFVCGMSGEALRFPVQYETLANSAVSRVDVYLFGDLNGIYLHDELYTPAAAKAQIAREAANHDRLAIILANAIGDFWLVVKRQDEVTVYSSPGSWGIFYQEGGGRIYGSSSEQLFYQNTSDSNLSAMEVLHYMRSRFSQRSPFGALTEGGRRCLGGQWLAISRAGLRQGFFLETSRYSTDQRSRAEMLPDFSRRLEAQVIAQHRAYERPRTLLQLSGGIDSAAVLAAALRTDLRFTSFHQEKSNDLTRFVRRLVNESGGGKLETSAQGEQLAGVTREKMVDLYRSGLGALGMDNMFLAPSFTQGRPLTLGGHSIGVLYQGHPAMFPAFRSGPRKRARKEAVFRPLRYLFSRDYIEQIGKSNAELAGRFGEKSLPSSGLEYLQNLALSYKFPLSVAVNGMRGSDQLMRRYRDWREEATLQPLMGTRYADARNGSSLDPQEVMSTMRTLRFAVNVQSASANMETYNRAGDVLLKDPPIEGPLIDMLQKSDITNYDVWNPKDLEFMYFHDVTGRRYYEDLIDGRSVLGYHYCEMRDFVYSRFRRLSRNNTRNEDKQVHRQPENTSAVRELVRMYIDPHKSSVVSRVEDDAVREFIVSQYSAIKDGAIDDFIQINQALNLEIFFRGIDGRL